MKINKRRMSFNEYKENGGIMTRQEFDRQESMERDYERNLFRLIDVEIFRNKTIKQEQKQLLQQGGY